MNHESRLTTRRIMRTLLELSTIKRHAVAIPQLASACGVSETELLNYVHECKLDVEINHHDSTIRL